MKNQATRNDVIRQLELRRAARLHALVAIPVLTATAFVIAYAILGLLDWS